MRLKTHSVTAPLEQQIHDVHSGSPTSVLSARRILEKDPEKRPSNIAFIPVSCFATLASKKCSTQESRTRFRSSDFAMSHLSPEHRVSDRRNGPSQFRRRAFAVACCPLSNPTHSETPKTRNLPIRQRSSFQLDPLSSVRWSAFRLPCLFAFDRFEAAETDDDLADTGRTSDVLVGASSYRPPTLHSQARIRRTFSTRMAAGFTFLHALSTRRRTSDSEEPIDAVRQRRWREHLTTLLVALDLS